MGKIGKPIAVLQMNSGSVQFGGVSAFLRNVYMHIDTDCVQCDFLSPDKTTFDSVRDEMEDRGATIFELGCGTDRWKNIRLIPKLRLFLKNHHYDVVHINSGSVGFNAIASWIVKHACSSKIIIHSHNTNTSVSSAKKAFYAVCRSIINHNADLKFACSIAAGKYMFGDDAEFTVINNGIELDHFKFDKDARERLRAQFLVKQTDLLVGFVGRLTQQKNPMFVIDVFEEIKKNTPQSHMLVVGNGDMNEEVQKRVREKNLEDSVIFLGNRNDVGELMQAMDALLLPSIFEGFGIVAIEAQTAGLKVFASDKLPAETNISKDITYISLDENAKEWADRIENVLSKREERKTNIAKDFDISEVSSSLMGYYLKLYEED